MQALGGLAMSSTPASRTHPPCHPHADFAHSGDCLLDELCLGWRHCELCHADFVQLAALAPVRARAASAGGNGTGSGDAGTGSDAEASRGARSRAAAKQQLLESSPWLTPQGTAPALGQAAVWHPGRLACLERLPAEFRALPGLVSLVRQAPAVVPADAEYGLTVDQADY